MSDTLINRIISFVLQAALYIWVVAVSLWMLFVLLSFDIIMIIISILVGLLIAAPLYYFAQHFWKKAAAA